MRKIIILLLLFATIFKIYPQDSINDSSSVKNDIAKDLIANEQIDTSNILNLKGNTNLIISKRDSIYLIPENIKDKVTILFQESKSGYFKYYFPFITLLLGILINQVIDYVSNRKRIRKEGLRWEIELKNLNKPLSNQIKNIESFIEDYKEDNFAIPTLKINSYLEADTFKFLDQTYLLKYLEEEKDKKYDIAIEQVNEINAFITEIRFNHETLKFKFKDYLDQTSNYIKSLTENLQIILKDIGYYEMLLQDELGRDPRNDARYRPILNLVNSQITPHLHDGKFNPFVLENDFYKPLLEFLTPHRFDVRTRDMLESISRGFNSIKGIRMERIYLSENLETIKNNFENNLEELPNINNELG